MVKENEARICSIEKKHENRKLKRNRNLGTSAVKAEKNLENDVKASACHNA